MAASLSAERVTKKTLDEMRAALFARGVRTLDRVIAAFSTADLEGDGRLDADEFDEALRWAGIFTTKQQLSSLFAFFDTDDDERISLDEFVTALRGSIAERRRSILGKAWQSIVVAAGGSEEAANSAQVPCDLITSSINAAAHPDVAAGKVSEEDLREEFTAALLRCADVFDGAGGEGAVADRRAFETVYVDISATVPSDDHFVAVVERCWGVTEQALGKDQQEAFDRYLDIIREKVRQKKRGSETAELWLRRAFQFNDVDETGGVDIDEFMRMLARLGLPLPLRDAMMVFKQFPPLEGSRGRRLDYRQFIKVVYAGGKGGE